MKRIFIIILLITIASSISTAQAVRMNPCPNGKIPPDLRRENYLGVKSYPDAKRIEAAEKLFETTRPPNWMALGVYHTDAPITQVIEHFKSQSLPKPPASADKFIRQFLQNSWKVEERGAKSVSSSFWAEANLADAIASASKIQTSFGVIVLKDSLLSVLLLAPYPSPVEAKMVGGTMIFIVRERTVK